MFNLIFAVCLIFSAWAAWHRNPTYSGRSTLRAALIVLLAIAGAIALIGAAVNLTIHASPVVSGVTLAVTIVVATLSLIFIIQAATVPKESKPAALPHSVKMVNVYRRKVAVWLKVFALAMLAFGIGTLIPGPPRYISLTLGSMTLFLGVILLPVLYYTYRTVDQSLTGIELNPWVHWQYTLDQWNQWSNTQADRMKITPPTFVLRRDWHKFIFPFSIIVIGVFAFVPGGWLWKTLYVSFVFLALLFIAVMSGRGGATGSEKLRAKLLRASPEAYFGRDGIFCDGVFSPWINPSTYLVSAAIDERAPRSLMFNFERVVPNPYGPVNIIPIHQAVLIPAGKESDLALLQQQLTARCPKAQIALA
jgi:hypothetical protein